MNTQHPALTPKRRAELAELAKWIDENEADELKAMAREWFAEHEAKARQNSDSLNSTSGDVNEKRAGDVG